jgi:hypothetical protein
VKRTFWIAIFGRSAKGPRFSEQGSGEISVTLPLLALFIATFCIATTPLAVVGLISDIQQRGARRSAFRTPRPRKRTWIFHRLDGFFP